MGSLDTITNAGSESAFKNFILNFLKPSPNSVYDCQNLNVLNLLPSCAWVLVTCENIN